MFAEVKDVMGTYDKTVATRRYIYMKLRRKFSFNDSLCQVSRLIPNINEETKVKCRNSKRFFTNFSD